METAKRFPDWIDSQRKFPENLNIQPDSSLISRAGRDNLQCGGENLARFAENLAEIRIAPQELAARISAAERKSIEAKFFPALTTMANLAASGIVRKPDLPKKPFNLSITFPRFLEGETNTVIPATAENLINGHARLFMDDAETQRIMEMLTLSSFKTPSPCPRIELVLETPGIDVDGKTRTALMTTSFGEGNFGMREMDISTAIQIALQKIFASEPGASTMLLTNKATKDGTRVAVSSITNSPITLREVEDPAQAADALQEIAPPFGRSRTGAEVSTSAVFSPLA